MLISPAYAQDAAGGGLAIVTQFPPLLLIFGVFYFLLIRPQQKKQKELGRCSARSSAATACVTGGGIIGKVMVVKDGVDEVEVEIAPNVRVSVLRQTIGDVLKPITANNSGARAEAAPRRPGAAARGAGRRPSPESAATRQAAGGSWCSSRRSLPSVPCCVARRGAGSSRSMRVCACRARRWRWSRTAGWSVGAAKIPRRAAAAPGAGCSWPLMPAASGCS